MKFTGVLSGEIAPIWAEVSGFIESGMDEGESLERIYDQITKAEGQLWIVIDDEKIIAACVSEIINLPTRKVFNILSLGGSQIEKWIHYLELIEAGARERGCTAIRNSNVRPGFQKILKGYRVTQVTVEKEL